MNGSGEILVSDLVANISYEKRDHLLLVIYSFFSHVSVIFFFKYAIDAIGNTIDFK